ncbi:hypothetical protein BLA29_006302, partial [Euroglyphus maynei]
MQRSNRSVPKIFQSVCSSQPDKTLFHYRDETWSFRRVDDFSNKVANYFLSQGFRKGDEVALFMENRPEYVCIWLGLAKAGIVSALINNNQRMNPLIHSLIVINCKALIFSSQLFQDRLLYIYTSGTEGMPKAAIIKNSRFIYMGAATRFMININSADVLYICLPLYHLAGGTIGVCQGVVFGNTIAIRSKFSASNFWKDCIQYQCTVSVAQYIGEICRYLLSQPESTCDRTHSIRLMFGNGLRQKIWKQF